MDAVLNLTMPTVFIDAHGSYPRTTLSVPVPAGMTIIETALPTQDTFAHIYNHLRALLFDPRPLVYLFYPKMAIDTPNKDLEHEDKVVALQQAIIKGEYGTVIEMVSLGEDPTLLHKLEELEAVVQSLTVYTTGDPIYSRELSFFDDGTFDDTCSITAKDIVLREDGFQAVINTPVGTTSAAIIAELTRSDPVKLIIMSCGHVGRGLAGFDLANAIMPIRQRFWEQRVSTAGPPSTHALSQGAYSTHEWCLDGVTLTKHIKNVVGNAYGRSAATETQGTYMEDDINTKCSSDYTPWRSQFLYVNTGGPDLGDGKADTYQIDAINPFIVATIDKLLLEYTGIIEQLYLIDKYTMNLVKVTDILDGIITRAELVPENADMIKIYMGSFAKYILNKYHMPADREAELVVPSFSDFKKALGSTIEESIKTWKFSEKMQALPVMASLNNFRSFRLLPIVRILNEKAEMLSTKDNDVVIGLIGTYREYLGEDIQFWINTKLGLPFESNIELSGVPDILAIQTQMKVASDMWRSRVFATRGAVQEENVQVVPNVRGLFGKRGRVGGFRITRKKRSRKGRKTHARRRRSRSSLR